ncbi:GNAT family N-acetyltransferase [Constantimarinum furrinae]|uniref:GCN5-related N-acetyltransferase n=1 Tax=Constantimarinum furrinae TaxID=2562285 RepID=A0A7G8PY25_9FLAO|nr:GNAT family N-acetyltransferase [Constantimarinum furrinae]QNJ99241.1 GCN5-related N-acetyltransferase [Constantimarinum furrinae]
MSTPAIRPIQKKDDEHIASVIRRVLEELNVPKTGTVYEDTSLDVMFETYNRDGAVYFVVEENNKIIGGGGISQLANFDGNVCELQKMYFLSEARGKGIGQAMLKLCFNAAREFGYEKCYLETMPYMKAAQKLYQQEGFTYLDGPLGDTGHFSCPVHMIKVL